MAGSPDTGSRCGRSQLRLTDPNLCIDNIGEASATAEEIYK
jgi:hypothetical protein